MRFLEHFLIVVLTVLLLMSCRTQNICPAYQSAFIFDTLVADQTFSTMDRKGNPLFPSTRGRKTKSGIRKSPPFYAFWKKKDQPKVIAKDYKYARDRKIDDVQDEMTEATLAMGDADTLEFGEVDRSLFADTTQVASPQDTVEHHFNEDQVVYMRYFIDYLPAPKAKAAPTVEEQEVDPMNPGRRIEGGTSATDIGNGKKKKKSWWPFKKKDKKDNKSKSELQKAPKVSEPQLVNDDEESLYEE
ncbi:hypothetical protein [Persicobacter psychrovividus]|uniref:Uncharacterized protein n=1 Tax=Persicobacter psychrovividus TaxID=387638 RepID=A0ABN6L5L9_9BACT|nr:hypothetical protein PEPS_07130 [Persicobacter psychrovividus]